MIRPFDKPVYVTRPYLPDLKAYQDGIAEIWKNQWLTNNGPVHQRYVKNLEAFFGTENLCVYTNGTLALQIALQGMGIKGEVITTPFTFVATAHCLCWNNIAPVFVDIDPETYTLDPAAVEAAITPRTTAILAVHVFGNPCNLDALQRIADKHHLALIYDAAHAFGVDVGGKSIGFFGDCSMFSLHSTKLYHSIEGGILVFRNPALKQVFAYLRNFGFKGETEVMMVGTNAKMTEMQALMGDLILSDLPKIIAKRKMLTEAYIACLKDVPGINIHALEAPLRQQVYTPNFAYVPVDIHEGYPLSRDALYEKLKTFNVYTRRYFYPLLTDFTCYRGQVAMGDLSVAKRVADGILTLPIYYGLETDDVCRICEMIAGG
ncbi:MAG: DegT/DnrJ/EryC1/StrS family aminotransferase [Kiritimatiellaeota bacterium]|nr:DegT/DnrJ/EryC1/StrS family aminotransferase [Kiritimatiellota bacterium]